MKLSKKILDKKEHGDILAIHKETGLSKPTIGNALRSGKGSRKTILAIEKFYKNLYK